MSTPTFAHPWILALLWLVPLALLGLAWMRARRLARSAAWISPSMRDRQNGTAGNWRFGLQLTLIGLGFALAIIALARPQYGEFQDKVTRRGRDLMIALDVSRSMLAADAAPNRLERAKTDLQDLVAGLEGDRAGLVLFRRKAVPVCPLTSDYAFLLQMLDAASPDSAPPGETDIGDAILKALDALDQQQSAHQAVILVTDGEDLAGAVDDAVQKAKERGVTIFTVGFGSTSGSPVPETDGGSMAYQGSEVRTKLNPAILHSIASRTGGVYVPVGTARTNLDDLYRNHLSKLKAREQDETITRRKIERFSWFLLPAILLWFLAAAFSAGRPQFRIAKPVATTLLALVLWPAAARAAETAQADPLRLARQAQAHYQSGHYEEAADLFRQAARSSANRETARDFFNAGCALYQAGRYPEAADCFRQAAGIKSDSALPWSYNLGCALLQGAQALEGTNSASARAKAERAAESAAAFQEAVRSSSTGSREQALNNLSLAGVKTEEARKQAHDLSVQERFGAMEAPQLAQQLLEGQRRLGIAVATALSNNTPSQITHLEKAGTEARDMADMIAPLAGKIEAAMGQDGGTNAAAQVAALRQHAGALNELLVGTANRLRDADSSAREMIPMGEQAAYILWKGIAPFDMLLREDIRVQSNLVGQVDGFGGKDPATSAERRVSSAQTEAAELTRLFSQRFAQAIPEGGQPAPPAPANGDPGDTNNPGITAETRAKILKLASECTAMQNDAVKAVTEKDWTAAETLARESLAKLKEIEDLLPKQKQNQQNQNQQNQDQQNQQQDSQGDQNQKDKQDNKPEPQPDPEPKQTPSSDKQTQQNQDKDEMSEDKARELLQKARLREKEYQDEKQKRAFFDRAPGERDW